MFRRTGNVAPTLRPQYHAAMLNDDGRRRFPQIKCGVLTPFVVRPTSPRTRCPRRECRTVITIPRLSVIHCPECGQKIRIARGP